MHERGQEARDWIRQNPDAFLILTLRRAYLYWLSPPELWHPGHADRPLRCASFAGVSLLGFVGLFLLFRAGHPSSWLFLAVLLGPSSVYLITHVNPRYRYLTFSPSVLLAGVAVAHVAAWLRVRALATSRKRERRIPGLKHAPGGAAPGR
jgi:hypothetical protein